MFSARKILNVAGGDASGFFSPAASLADQLNAIRRSAPELARALLEDHLEKPLMEHRGTPPGLFLHAALLRNAAKLSSFHVKVEL